MEHNSLWQHQAREGLLDSVSYEPESG